MFENINLGSAANDGTGDSLRVAGGKINEVITGLDSGYNYIPGEVNYLFTGSEMLGDTELEFEKLTLHFMRVGDQVFLSGSVNVTSLSGNFPSDASSLLDFDASTLAQELGWFTSTIHVRGLGHFNFYGENSDKPITPANIYHNGGKIRIRAGETTYVNTTETMIKADIYFNCQLTVVV